MLRPGTELACNDNACGQLSSLDVPVTQGAIYRIRIGGRSNLDMGTYLLNVGFTAAPGTCYANCDGSTSSPRLTANDFQCFLNAFAAGCS